MSALLLNAKRRACQKWPFAAHAILSMAPVETPRETLAVDQHWRLYFNEEYLREIGEEAAAGVILHELSHLLGKHHKRGEHIAEPDWKRWNHATDAAINERLRAEGVTLPAGVVYPETHDLEPGDSAEGYYRQLTPAPEPEEDSQPQPEDGGDDDGEPQDEGGDGAGGDGAGGEGGGDGEPQGEGDDGTDGGGGEDEDAGGVGGRGDNEDRATNGDGEAGDDGEEPGSGGGSAEQPAGEGSSGGDSDGDPGDPDEGGDADRGSRGVDPSGDAGGGGCDGDAGGLQRDIQQDPHDGVADAGTAPGGGSCSDGQPRDWELGDPGDGDDEAPGLDEADIDQIVHVTAERAASEQFGSTSAAAKVWANEILDPPLDPAAKIRHLVRQYCDTTVGFGERSYRRPSRRNANSRMCLPSNVAPLPRIKIIVDTSYSMVSTMRQRMGKRDRIALALGTIQKVMSSFRIRDGIEVMTGDTECNAVTLCVSDPRKIDMRGGGGTDMGKLIEQCMASKPRPQLIIVCTDGETPWPSKDVGVPVVACLTAPENTERWPVPAWIHSLVL